MGFSISPVSPITSISNNLTNFLDYFVSSNLTNLTNAVVPAIAIGMTIILIYETAIQIQQPNGDPLSGLIMKFVRWGIIISIAGAGGWYQQSIANAIMKTPDELANVIILSSGNTTNANSMVGMMDTAYIEGMKVTKYIFSLGSIGLFDMSGVVFIILGVCSFGATILFIACGSFLLILSKALLTIILALGSLAILCKLFKSTNGIFDKWVGACIACGMISVLLSIIFALCDSYFLQVTHNIQNANTEDVALNVVTLAIIVLLSAALFAQLPFFAIWIGSGFHSMFNTGLNRLFGNSASKAQTNHSINQSSNSSNVTQINNSNQLSESNSSFVRGSASGAIAPKI